MYRERSNKHVVHPKDLLEKDLKGVNKFNDGLAVRITKAVGTMWSAYLFAFLSFTSLPAIIVAISPASRHYFPAWLIKTSMITLIAWISQNFLQLVLLPIIMVGQNVIQRQEDAKASADHKTLTYIANYQEEQMEELQKQTKLLEDIKDKI